MQVRLVCGTYPTKTHLPDCSSVLCAQISRNSLWFVISEELGAFAWFHSWELFRLRVVTEECFMAGFLTETGAWHWSWGMSTSSSLVLSGSCLNLLTQRKTLQVLFCRVVTLGLLFWGVRESAYTQDYVLVQLLVTPGTLQVWGKRTTVSVLQHVPLTVHASFSLSVKTAYNNR